MNSMTTLFNLYFIKAIKRSPAMTLLLLLPAIHASAQAISTTDGFTPGGLTPGSPASSYALSGFDTINPFNGNLDFHLPLLQVGGRGEARMTMMLALNTKKWRVKTLSTTVGGGAGRELCS